MSGYLQQAVVVQIQLRHGLAHHVGIQMAALAGVDLQRGCAGGANARGIVVGLLVAFDHRERQAAIQRSDAFHQQRSLAGTGAGYKIQREDAMLGQPGAIVVGVAVVLGKDVLLDLHHARLAHAGRMRTCRAEAIVNGIV
jgi:hypothetical protein